jgi:hypothetical protein
MRKLLMTTLLCSTLLVPATPEPARADSGETVATILLLGLLAQALSNNTARMDHGILIESDDDIEYRIEVTGRLESVDAIGLERGDTINGGVATGRVERDADAFVVEGNILRIVVSDPRRVTVIVDGVRLAADELIDGGRVVVDPPPAPQPPAPPEPGRHAASFAGTWSSSFGTLDIVQFIVGNEYFLIGDYANRGILVGRVYGTCASGIFTNDRNAGANGSFRFRLDGADSFEGDWHWSTDRSLSAWEGTRRGGSPLFLDNFWGGRAFAIDIQRGVAPQTGLWNGDLGQMHAHVGSNIWVSDVDGPGDADGVLAALSSDGVTYFGLMTRGNRNVAVSFDARGPEAQGSYRELPSGTQTVFEMAQTRSRRTGISPELGSTVLSCR